LEGADVDEPSRVLPVAVSGVALNRRARAFALATRRSRLSRRCAWACGVGTGVVEARGRLCCWPTD